MFILRRVSSSLNKLFQGVLQWYIKRLKINHTFWQEMKAKGTKVWADLRKGTGAAMKH